MSTIHCAVDWHAPVDKETIFNMLAASDYWQPDLVSYLNVDGSTGVSFAKACLFNRPLSERDTVIVNDNQSLYLVANAHLDNRTELAAKLVIKDISNLSDGELIIRAYEHWGDQTASHLLGDFVFILWDKNKKQLYCARDHFGVKSLFFAIEKGRVILSNEHKALLVDGVNTKRTLSFKWLAANFFPFSEAEFCSPFEAIDSLPAGHQLIVNQSGHQIIPYWTLNSAKLPKSTDEEYITQLKALFAQAIERRLVSMYPLAAELSEGLDSNAVVGYASRQLGDSPLYTMSFNGVALNNQNSSEWQPVYQELFDACSLWPNVTPLWTDDDAPIFKAGAHSEHFGGPSSMSSWFDPRCRLASSQQCRTILSGWGGDHCVSGYGDEYVHELFSKGKLVSLLRLMKFRRQRGRSGKPLKMLTAMTIERLFPYVYQGILKKGHPIVAQLKLFANNSVLKGVDNIYRDRLLKKAEDIYRRHSVKQRDFNELIKVGVQNRITQTELCARVQRCEFRYPLLDKDLVEFAYNLPGHLKCKHGIERYMFRELLKGYTTERIRLRAKADVLTSGNMRSVKLNVASDLPAVIQDWSPELDSLFELSQLESIAKNSPHVAVRNLQVIKSLQKYLKQDAIRLTST